MEKVDKIVELSYCSGCHDAYRLVARSFGELMPAEIEALCKDMADSYAAQIESLKEPKQ